MSFSTGAFIKMYDDLVDHGVGNKEWKPYLEVLCCFLHTILGVRDFFFGIMLYAIYFVNYLLDETAFVNKYEFSYILFFPIVLLIGWSPIHLEPFDIVIVVSSLALIAFESIALKDEEVGKTKCAVRFVETIGCIGTLVMFGDYISASMQKVVLYTIGYTLVSTIHQYMQISQIPSDTSRPDSSSHPGTSESEKS